MSAAVRTTGRSRRSCRLGDRAGVTAGAGQRDRQPADGQHRGRRRGPNRIGGRLYQGSGSGSARMRSSSWRTRSAAERRWARSRRCSPRRCTAPARRAGASSCDHASARNVADGAPSAADSLAASPAAPAAHPRRPCPSAHPLRRRPRRHARCRVGGQSAVGTSAAPAATLSCDWGVVTTGARSRADSCWVTSGMLAPPPTVATAEMFATGMLLRCSVSSMASSSPASGSGDEALQLGAGHPDVGVEAGQIDGHRGGGLGRQPFLGLPALVAQPGQ